MGGREPGVQGHRSGERRGIFRRLHESEEAGDPCVALLDRKEQPAVRHVRDGPFQRRGEIAGALVARRVLRTEAGVAADLFVRRLRVPDEVAGWVDADHHRTVDGGRVAPGVDHRGAGARAFAQQVDLVVAEGFPCRLEVVDPFGECVAGEIDAVCLEPLRARAERVRVGIEGLLAEEVGGVLEGRFDLRAVEPDRAVDAAVADEDDVVVGGEPTGVRELHVRDAGAAFQAEDRGARVCRMRTDPDDRQRDQPRVRVGAVFAHHERSAVGGVGALLGVVGTVFERQLACMRAGRHGDGRRTAGEG